MAKIRMPGSEVLLDPDEIVQLEISSSKNPHVAIQISLENRAQPMVLEFSDRRSAIDFYNKIWSARESIDEEIVEVGDFS